MKTAAIDALADQVENGHLLASMGGEDLLLEAARKIESLRAEADRYREALKEAGRLLDRARYQLGMEEVLELCGNCKEKITKSLKIPD